MWINRDKNTPSSQDACPPTIGVGKKDGPPNALRGWGAKHIEIPGPRSPAEKQVSSHRGQAPGQAGQGRDSFEF